MADQIKGATSTAAPKPTPAANAFDAEATAAAESQTGPRSPVVKFKQKFDYTWPSRAMTSYKAGWQGRVKAEVATAAEKAGVLDTPVDGGAETK